MILHCVKNWNHLVEENVSYNEMCKGWKSWDKEAFYGDLLFTDTLSQKSYLELHKDFGQNSKKEKLYN